MFRPVDILFPHVGGPNSVARKLINLIEKLALALGRPSDEIEVWCSGSGTIDGDVVMKARGIAIQRGIEIDPANGGNEDA
jgi:hypothetical protein